MHPDGICYLGGRSYSKSIEFFDVNYQLAQPDDQTAIFEYLCDLYNYLDASIHVQLMSGKHTSNHCIYGYRKDPNNKDHWIIDEEAAEVVRRIYRMAIEGKGPYEIARILATEKVERPSYYLAQRGMGNHQSNYNAADPYTWRGGTVADILSKQEYMGHTVNFRTYKESYKDKRVKMTPKEDLVIFENTQEAIIDKETWERVQTLRKTIRRTDSIQPVTGDKPVDLQRNNQHQQEAATPDALMTGERITTPRGSFHVTGMTREQMEAAGYGYHHSSEDGKYLIMGNGTQAYAIAAEQRVPENYMRTAELTTEQNYNMIDGRINNTPSVDELEEKAKRGEVISLSALAAAVKAEDGRTPQRSADGKKPSIRAQLKADRAQTAAKPKQKEKEQEAKRSIRQALEME